MDRRSTLATTVAAIAVAAAGGLVPLAAQAHPVATHAPIVTAHRLVSDKAGSAPLQDPDLVNAWGMSHAPGGPLWVSDNGSDVSTIYTGGTAGAPAHKLGLTVTIPGGAPTGQVYNGTSGFVIPSTGNPALFVFAGEGGEISAWNGSTGSAAVSVANEGAAVFKGLALEHTTSGPRLLVANFGAARIDVFDSAFAPVTLGAGAFTDPYLPAGYAPFNVAVFDGRVYVTYAKQDATATDDVPGPGHGFLDVYSRGGTFLHRLVSRGALDSPWGMVLAPKTFGAFAGALLVGNFGDGTIHAYRPRTGALLGALRNRAGHVIHIDGLWGLTRGDSAAGGSNAVWFSAGPGGESHGLLGVLRAS